MIHIRKNYVTLIALFSFLLWSAGTALALESADKNKCETTDIVIAIDTTYSLNHVIYDIRLEMEALLERMVHVSDGKLRLGLVGFKDDLTIIEDLNDQPSLEVKLKKMTQAMHFLRARGGGAGPEASDEALRTIIHALPATNRRQNRDFTGRFMSDTKIIILITDNRPGGFNDRYQKGIDAENAANRAFEASEQGILISSIYIPANRYEEDKVAKDIMRDYALITGGLFIQISTTGDGAAEAIANIIDSCGRRPMV